MIFNALVRVTNRYGSSQEESQFYIERVISSYLKLITNEQNDLTSAYFVSAGDGKKAIVPDRNRTSGAKAVLLVDKEEYVWKEGKRRDEFAKLIRQCFRETQEEKLKPVVAFYDRIQEFRDAIHPVYAITKGEKWIEIIVNEERLVDIPTIQAWWDTYCTTLTQSKTIAMCSVCGQVRGIARIHDKIDTKVGRFALTSCNIDAGKHYGRDQSENALICMSCVEKYRKAFTIMEQRKWSTIVSEGDNAILLYAWPDQRETTNWSKLIFEPDIEQLHKLAESIYTGIIPIVDQTIHMLRLSSYLKFRGIIQNYDMIEESVLCKNVLRYFRMQNIGDKGPIRAWQLVNYTLPMRLGDQRSKNRDYEQLYKGITDLAYEGIPVPHHIFARVLDRIRVFGVNHERAVWVKLYLESNGLCKEDEWMGLNPDHPSEAYHMGRLLSVLNRIKYTATSSKESVSDKNMATCMSYPSHIFPELIRKAQIHLAKSESFSQEKQMAEIISKINEFPTHLSDVQKSEFVLGFYHQEQDFFDKIESNKEVTNQTNEE